MVDRSALQPLFYDFISNEYVSKNVTEDGLCAFQFVENSESRQWNIIHNRNFIVFKVNVFSENNTIVYPDQVKVTNENSITLEFSEPQSGVANIVYYTNDSIGCTPEQLIQEVIFAGINSGAINDGNINGPTPII